MDEHGLPRDSVCSTPFASAWPDVLIVEAPKKHTEIGRDTRRKEGSFTLRRNTPTSADYEALAPEGGGGGTRSPPPLKPRKKATSPKQAKDKSALRAGGKKKSKSPKRYETPGVELSPLVVTPSAPPAEAGSGLSSPAPGSPPARSLKTDTFRPYSG